MTIETSAKVGQLIIYYNNENYAILLLSVNDINVKYIHVDMKTTQRIFSMQTADFDRIFYTSLKGTVCLNP